jgi:hypothetical protein
MPRYNWRYPLGRLIGASFFVFCWLFARSGGPEVPLGRPPVICNGDVQEYLLVFVQLVGAALFIEILSWAFWLVDQRRRVHSAQQGTDDLNEHKLSGGELLGLGGSIYSLVFAIALVVLSGRVIGVPDPCPPMSLNPFTWRHFMGGMLMMYGILGGINYLLEKIDGSRGKPAI